MPRSPVNAQPLALFSQASHTLSTDRHRRNQHALQKAQFAETVEQDRAASTARVAQDLHQQVESLKAGGLDDDEAWDTVAAKAPEAFTALAGNASAVEGANNLRIQQAGADDDRRFVAFEQEVDPATGQPTGRVVRQFANARTKSVGPETVRQSADDDDEVVRISRGQALRELTQGGMAGAGKFGHTFGEGGVAAAGDVNRAHLSQAKAQEEEIYRGLREQGLADREARVEAQAQAEAAAAPAVEVNIPSAGVGGDLRGFAQQGGSGEVVPDSGMNPADLDRRDPNVDTRTDLAQVVDAVNPRRGLEQAFRFGASAMRPVTRFFENAGAQAVETTRWLSENHILPPAIAEAMNAESEEELGAINLSGGERELLNRRNGGEGPVGVALANNSLADPSTSAEDRKTNAALYTMQLPGVAGLPRETQQRTIQAGADVLGTPRTPRQIEAYARMMSRTQNTAQERTPQQLRAALYMHSLDQLSTAGLEKFVGGQAIVEEPPGDPVVMTRDGRLFDRRTNKFLDPEGMSVKEQLEIAQDNQEFNTTNARMALAANGPESPERATWYQNLEPEQREAAEAGTLGVALHGRNLIMNLLESPDGSTVDITNPQLRQDLRVMAFSMAADVYHSQVNARKSGWGPWASSGPVYQSLRDHPLFDELMEGLRGEVQ